MLLKEIDQYLQELLCISDFAGKDSSMNGVQLGNPEQEIETIAFAVDACQATIDRASAAGAQMLFVHHGLFWGRPLPLTGSHYNRVNKMMDSKLALYAVHLPLDAHSELGNNITMANRLGLEECTPFGNYKGKAIGFQGRFNSPKTINEVIALLGTREEDCLSILPFGSPEISTVGIVSGGAPMEVMEAIDKGLDLYITGDASHAVYHNCLESGTSLIAAGHYHTETFGVQAVADKIKQDLQLKTLFIDMPTRL